MQTMEKTIYELMAYINLNLAEKLTLDFLAEKFCYSKFHLHREFKRVVGTTLNNYLKRRRIEHSIYFMFANIQEDIAEIANYTGFSSATYSREFKKIFGKSPKQYRNIYKKNDYPEQDSKICKNYQKFLCYSDQGAPEEIKKISKIDMNDTEIWAGIFFGNYYSADFELFCKKIKVFEKDNVPLVGVPLNSPSVTDSNTCLYILGFINQGEIKGLSRFTIHGGRYLKIDFHGPRNKIGAAYTWLLKYYLPQMGIRYDYRVLIQQFEKDGTFDSASDMKLYIPIKLT